MAEPPQVDPDATILWQPVDTSTVVDLGHDVQPVPEAERVDPGQTAFTEVAASAFLGDTVAGGNSHGVGVGFFDVDGDGWEDVLIANGRTNDDSTAYGSQLWRNNGDGTFRDESVASGVAGILAGKDTYSIAAADFDADGDLDVHITTHPTDLLLVNQGDGTFVDGTSAAGLGGPPSEPARSGSSKIGAFGDLDNDGYVDLAVASSQFLSHSAHVYVMRNRGDGTFEDATGGTRVSDSGNPCAVLWTDYDNDGWQDLMVWNDRGNASRNRTLLRNLGDGTFGDVTEATLLNGPAVGNPMGIDSADVNRDGFLDYYVGNIGGNVLLLSRGDGTFIDTAAAAGVLGTFGWGLGFEDLNADTYWDLFVAQEDERDYLSFTNQGQTDPPQFTEQGWSHGLIGDGHNVAVAFADYDHDGDVDVVTAGTSGARANLFRNDTERGTARWLEVRVTERPITGARGGVAGRVVVETPEVTLWRDLTAGSSRASQSALSARFGLGQFTGAERVAVVWPDGSSLVVVGVEGNQTLTLP